ncbi:unnamed protein product [Nezara viridula]|uniref:Uncharacterized protein n=1 Tax=Nezara viridula TaxID=85310 RepID=A0A9P0E3P2_NEZVI|nr:unnamed protein product [Nezara viridula]
MVSWIIGSAEERLIWQMFLMPKIKKEPEKRVINWTLLALNKGRWRRIVRAVLNVFVLKMIVTFKLPISSYSFSLLRQSSVRSLLAEPNPQLPILFRVLLHIVSIKISLTISTHDFLSLHQSSLISDHLIRFSSITISADLTLLFCN